MGMTGAERQRRYRERRAGSEPVRTFQRPKDRRSRPRRWADAVEDLRTLQGEYEAWREQLTEGQAGSPTADLLESVCDIDLDVLDVQLPRGFGRD